MAELAEGQVLPVREVVAHNFAADSENKIHSDDVASEYGFKGGLVPGVGVYAYMTQPVVQALGRDWLVRGDMTGKFIKPVYHGETVYVKSRVVGIDPIRITVTAENANNELCAIGEASFSETKPQFTLTKYTLSPPPHRENRLAPSLSVLKKDLSLGALVVKFTDPEWSTEFLKDVVESEPIYQEPDVTWHPAVLPALANRVLVENINLGPWIHTDSDVDHHALPDRDEEVVVRSRIISAYEKRGHEMITIHVAFTGHGDRVLALMTHTAIVNPAKQQA